MQGLDRFFGGAGVAPYTEAGRHSCRKALKALNGLVADGVIATYAIGGVVGAAFYIEAVQTEDLDAFVFLSPGRAA